MNREDILSAAKAAPSKMRIEEHREAVQILRDKGYTWREIADFLNKQGIQTDHTRVYRIFGKLPKQNPPDARAVQIHKVTYVGERKTKRNNTWNVLELELPSKLGLSIILIGHAWGSGVPSFALEDENRIAFRNASLVIRSGNKFPFAYINLEFKMEGDVWSAQDVYIMPKWDALL